EGAAPVDPCATSGPEFGERQAAAVKLFPTLILDARRAYNAVAYSPRQRSSHMLRRAKWLAAVMLILAAAATLPVQARAQKTGPAQWQNDLTPIAASDWNYDFAAHLLERAGFGGAPEEIEALARLTPAEAVRRLVYFQNIENNLPAFDHSGVHDPGLEPFPESRPPVTKQAKEKGEALGLKVKSGGDRPLQPIVNKFFYWLRASVLETQRVAYWWANRMVATRH